MSIELCGMKRFVAIISALLCMIPLALCADSGDKNSVEHPVDTDLPVEAIPDLSGQNKRFKFLSKIPEGLLIVPIPMSSPTFGTGLILGGAYFYRQTEEQKKAQPASFTGAAAGYTDNKSWFGGVMQQNYWSEDRWRFTGVAGYLDFKLELNPADSGEGGSQPADWLVDGAFVQARVSRKLRGNWYLGLTGRYLDITQAIDLNAEDEDFNLLSQISSTGVGLNLDFDSRDLPSNPYRGRFFELKALTSNQSNSDAGSYQSYRARFRSYHQLSDPLVLAWDISACSKDGRVPLWDTCRLALRGFSATDYLSKQSLYAQAEVRWRFYKKWGMVAFAGAGRVDDSFGGRGEDDTIPSYGVGIRFMLLESQRINLRIDYARSDHGEGAWYLAVTEAF
jgi:hypothetical protein